MRFCEEVLGEVLGEALEGRRGEVHGRSGQAGLGIAPTNTRSWWLLARPGVGGKACDGHLAKEISALIWGRRRGLWGSGELGMMGPWARG